MLTKVVFLLTILLLTIGNLWTYVSLVNFQAEMQQFNNALSSKVHALEKKTKENGEVIGMMAKANLQDAYNDLLDTVGRKTGRNMDEFRLR